MDVIIQQRIGGIKQSILKKSTNNPSRIALFLGLLHTSRMKSKRHSNFNFAVMTLALVKGIFDVWSQFGFQSLAMWLITIAVGILTVLMAVGSVELVGNGLAHLISGLWIAQGGLFVLRIGSFGKPTLSTIESWYCVLHPVQEKVFGLTKIDFKTILSKSTTLKRTSFPSLAPVFNRRQGAYALHPVTQSLLFFA